MSQHIVEKHPAKYVFGWDQPLQSFYLQIHDLTKDEDTEGRIPVWLGADPDTKMYEVEDLVRAGQKHGLYIPHARRTQLYAEKDDGV